MLINKMWSNLRRALIKEGVSLEDVERMKIVFFMGAEAMNTLHTRTNREGEDRQPYVDDLEKSLLQLQVFQKSLRKRFDKTKKLFS